MPGPRSKKKEAVGGQAPPQIYRLDAFAEILQCDKRTARRFIDKGLCASVKIGGIVGVTSEQLQDFLQRHTRPAFDAEAIAQEMLSGEVPRL